MWMFLVASRLSSDRQPPASFPVSEDGNVREHRDARGDRKQHSRRMLHPGRWSWSTLVNISRWFSGVRGDDFRPPSGNVATRRIFERFRRSTLVNIWST